MGASTSKVARKLPTKARPETLKNAPVESPSTLQAQIQAASGNKKHKFTSFFFLFLTFLILIELKSEFIEQDSRDPHLDQHLKTIGTVSIPPTITKMRTVRSLYIQV